MVSVVVDIFGEVTVVRTASVLSRRVKLELVVVLLLLVLER